MPFYEYRCNDCGHEFEAMQKMSDSPLTNCPECRKPELIKLISAAGFRLKGSGWYETDFKPGNKKNVQDTGKQDTSKQDTSKQDTSKQDTSKNGPAPSSGKGERSANPAD